MYNYGLMKCFVNCNKNQIFCYKEKYVYLCANIVKKKSRNKNHVQGLVVKKENKTTRKTHLLGYKKNFV